MSRLEFFTTDLDGITLVNPGEGERRRILQSVENEDPGEYPEVYLTVKGGPVISYRAGGVLLWEENREVVRYTGGVSLEAAQRAWDQLVAGHGDELEKLDWVPVED